MENFVFQSPTKIIFGKGTECQVGAETRVYSKNSSALWWRQHKTYWPLR